ncbi:MAG: methylenetetrahydrofolate reductase [NAD(P)H] [Christensenellales bacterium]|jgi:methylenetetrahydrofolate reductase (NADPH)
MPVRISDLFARKRAVYSLEVFPPKPTGDIAGIYRALQQMKDLSPDYVSVTYGAGGGGSGRTIEVAAHIKDACSLLPLAHLTGIHNTKDGVRRTLDELSMMGIGNVLALRGDLDPDEPAGEFRYAAELIEFIKAYRPELHISAACYPQVHPEAASLKDDLQNLKRKVDAGADHLISQLFYDNEMFYDFLSDVRGMGIEVPISAGIMPVINTRQIKRITSLCGATLTPKFLRAMMRYQDDAQAMRDIGITYASEQIMDLLAAGVSGIHLYTMNKPLVAARITQTVRRALDSVNERKAP